MKVTSFKFRETRKEAFAILAHSVTSCTRTDRRRDAFATAIRHVFLYSKLCWGSAKRYI